MSQQPPAARPPYQKPWLSHADQVAQLVSRGLTVAAPAAAAQFLSHVNYYRFSGYCLAFEGQRHQFNAGCTFEEVRAAYDFDLVLRDILTDALEILEVDFRAAIAYHFGQRHGGFGHIDPANFFKSFQYADWLDRLREEARRSSEQFIAHFRGKYAQFPDLPIWMAMEVMSFGALSKMFKGMHRADQRIIAHRYRLQPVDLVAVFHHLVYVRNLCAHHSRLWDRTWAIKPSLPKGKDWQSPQVPTNDRLFASLLLQYHLMKQCPAVGVLATDWRDRVKQHLASPPTVADPLQKMGMPMNWDQHPVWK
jgi:abortive infection bacteriophage resistance protein